MIQDHLKGIVSPLMLLVSSIFDQLLIFVNLYQHTKNQFIPSIHSSDTVNFKFP